MQFKIESMIPTLKSHGLQRSNVDCNVYFSHENDKVVILVLYVDDLLLTRNHSEKIIWLREQLLIASKMIDLGCKFIYR
ncbi:unnamed protein product [Sphagnum jensenii]|uniref:Reverse transcriptase Ty1/copia-type domain-containing protein n=1 Tax=Sphagnum jensenii TaxID=128206 RepID=A0ABP0XE41_9BRYO